MKILLLILTLAACLLASPGEMSRLEKDIELLSGKLAEQQAMRQKIESGLEALAVNIETHKAQPQPDRKLLNTLMSTTLDLSGQLEKIEQQIGKFSKELDELKTRLDGVYSQKIDSLQAVQQRNTNPETGRRLDSELIGLVEKRIALNPAITGLSFRWEKIESIRFSETNDSLEFAIYRDYLQNARSEIDNRIEQVQKLHEELEQLSQLERKAEEFMAEVQENENITLFAESSTSESRDAALNNQPGSGQNETYYKNQMESSALLLQQLNRDETSFSSGEWHTDAGQPGGNISRQDHINLLKELEKRLAQYRMLVEEKLNQAAK